VRRTGPRPVAFALEGFTADVAPATTIAAVQRVWHQAAMGFADHAQPTSERDGVITVKCSEAVWASEMNLMQELIVSRLNEALGRPLVRRLRVQANAS
jgi:predicted nucleic acid-binding Zn ribbon protein